MLHRHTSRIALLALVASLALAVWAYFWVFSGLPDSSSLSRRARLESTKVVDRNGVVLFEMPDGDDGKRTRVPLAEFPIYLRQASIATEDSSFYENPGVDVVGIVRALAANTRGGEIVAGGSTITQQLIRTALLPPEERGQRTLRRKVREAVLAAILTRLYSKDALLEAYLNEAYYGNMAYGSEAAAQAYFGKHARDLDLAESTLLVGLTQSPAAYNPLINPSAALQRQAIVLDLMVRNGYITEGQSAEAKTEDLKYAPAPFDIKAPHFVAYVKDVLDQGLVEERNGGRGLRVVTTLDYSLQSLAEETIRSQIGRLKDSDVTSGSLVAMDPRSGEVLAMVGSADYFDREIDGAVNIATSLRQPGSSIKPLTYAAAFSRGWSPATVVPDVRTTFPTREGSPFVPANYDYTYHGPVSLRQALGSSINVPAVRVLEYVGLTAFIEFAHELGISSLSDDSQYGLSLTLGGGEVTLLELTSAYAVFANGGVKQPLRTILRIEDNGGNVLYRSSPGPASPVLDPRAAFLIGDILSDDSARRLTFGSYSALRLSRPAAVKTGTTSSWRDNWAIGYTPDLVVGVWVGNADGSPMKNISGVTGAAPIWHDFMEEAGKVREALSFVEPAGLVRADVCPESGQRPGPYCPYRKKEFFIAGSEPRETCTLHQKLRVCREENRLATPNCPEDQVDERIFTIYPSELAGWAAEMGVPQPPSGYCAMHGEGEPVQAPARPSIMLTSPDHESIYALDPGLPATLQRIEVAAVVTGEPAAVRFLIDGAELATLTRRPYSTLWQLAKGDHTIAAIALDEGGREMARSEVQVRVMEE